MPPTTAKPCGLIWCLMDDDPQPMRIVLPDGRTIELKLLSTRRGRNGRAEARLHLHAPADVRLVPGRGGKH